MKTDQKKARALGLCSGGLDSILAGLVLRQQDIHVEWITFETPFFSAAKARKASEQTGIPLTVQNITPTYLEMLRKPNCGYGKQMNPCLDCHALMFNLAGQEMERRQFDFLFSGEVVGQRPMSQTKPSLRYVEKHSGFDGYIVRPLSARRLPETIPEKKGWVQREGLLDFAGRGRKAQIKLARQFGVTDYPAPAGGCLLTDVGYSRRLKDLFEHQDDCTENELHLLKFGRHFRVDSESKIITGRTKDENEQILQYHDPREDTLLKTKTYPGPMGLIPGAATHAVISLGASICAGYSKAPRDVAVEVNLTTPRGRKSIEVVPIPPSTVKHLLI